MVPRAAVTVTDAGTVIPGSWFLQPFEEQMPMSKRVSIATPEPRSLGVLEVSYVNGRGFNFDVAPSLVGIWCPLIYKVGDVGGSE